MKSLLNKFQKCNYLSSLFAVSPQTTKHTTRLLSFSHNIIEGTNSADEPPILMAHGLMGNKNNFKSISKKLNELTGRMVITYDARNHGASPHYPSMTLHEMSWDAVELLNMLSVEKCVFIGHSMGGRTAMYSALACPKYIDRLIVIDSAPTLSTSVKSGGSTMHYIEAMENVVWKNVDSLSTARLNANRQLPEDIKDEMIRNFLLTNVQEILPGKYGWRVNLVAIRDHMERSRHIHLNDKIGPYDGPTLFIAGGNSDFITPTDYPDIKKLFPSSTVSHISNCGHWVHAERPDEFVKTVVDFLYPKKLSLFD